MASRCRSVPFRRSPVRSSRPAGSPLAAIPVAAALMLVGCDSGGGSGDDPPGAADESELIIGGSAGGRAAGEIDEETLRRNALERASAGLGLNLGSLGGLVGEDDDVVESDVIGPSDGMGMGGVPIEPATGDAGEPDDVDDMLETLDDGSDDFLRRTLGVDDPNARVTRDGDVITIDPDDAALCSDDPAVEYDDGLVLDDGGSNADCLALVSDLTVTLDARTEQSGIIGYRFEDEPLLSLGYSPGGAAVELSLDGIGRVLRRIETIEGVEPSGVTIAGTLRFAARVFDDTPGQESGEIEISVTETIAFGTRDSEAGLTLGPSRVLKIGVDEAAETVVASVAWGALRLIAESEDDDGDDSPTLAATSTATTTTTIDLGGLTFDLDAMTGESSSDELSVRNIGIGGVPLNIRVGSSDALTLALETFGVTLDGDGETLTFDTAAGVNLVLDNLGGAFEDMASDYRARLTASAPAGTALADRGEGVLEVTGGGPLEASVDASDGVGSTQSAISAGVGECLTGEAPPAASPDGEPTDADRLVDGLVLATPACP